MTLEMANRFGELRRRQAMSQEMLAEKLGVSRQAISKWERGEACPDIENLIMLADLYGVSMDELIRGGDSPTEPGTPDAWEPEEPAHPEPEREQPPAPEASLQSKEAEVQGKKEEEASGWKPVPAGRRRRSRAWLMFNPFTNLGVSMLFLLAWLGMIIFVILVGADPFSYYYYGSAFFAVNESFRMGNYIGFIFVLPWLFRMIYGAAGHVRLYEECNSTAEKFFRAFPYALLVMVVDIFGLTYGHSGWWLFYLTIPMYEWIVDSVFGEQSWYRIAAAFPISSVLLCASCFLSMVWGSLLPYFLLLGIAVYYGVLFVVWAVKKNHSVQMLIRN